MISTILKTTILAVLLAGVLSEDIAQELPVPTEPALTEAAAIAEVSEEPKPILENTLQILEQPLRILEEPLKISEEPEQIPAELLFEDIDGVKVPIEPRARARFLEKLRLEQEAANAVYTFASSIVDGIMDNNQNRTETRDGLNLKGSYSYSDGYFRRTVNYVAGTGGFRVVSEVVEELGDGPKLNPLGRADVRTYISGQGLEYSITKDDIRGTHKNKESIAELEKIALETVQA
ncbi:uncharacterized protein LOC125500146 [Athalia rosae]|uniref:uncharacterized protein LOC125500146 n=1 Tax=Athalia rosae TaxID=37344 RepID=UPI0020343795|nr:uncharacterized protein LOC125500146 [Athalia rosae]